MNIPLLIVLVYVILLFFVSWYSTKLSKNEGAIGFLLAGKKLPAILVATMLAAAAVGGSSTVGVAEKAYTVGLSSAAYNVSFAIAMIVAGLFFIKRYRDLASTIPELFMKYFDEKAALMATIVQLCLLVVITSLQYVAGGAILTALLPNVFTFLSGMTVTAIVFVGITLIGGLWAATLTNVINLIVIYLGLIIGAISSIAKVGGFSKLAASLPANAAGSTDFWFNPLSGLGFGVIVAWIVVQVTSQCYNQSVAQYGFAAKSGDVARRGIAWSAVFIFPAGFISAMFGIVAAASFPGLEKASMALPTVVTQLLNPYVGGLLLAGLWAADISTACGVLLASSTILTKNIWMEYFQPNLDSQKQVFVSRLSILFLAVLTYFMAVSIRSILGALMFTLNIMVSFFVVLSFALFAPRFCKKNSAFFTMLAGMVGMVIWKLIPSSHVFYDCVYLELVICLATFSLVYLLDKTPAKVYIAKTDKNKRSETVIQC